MASCAIPTSSAGQAPAGATTRPKLTFKSDHHAGAGQDRLEEAVATERGYDLATETSWSCCGQGYGGMGGARRRSAGDRRPNSEIRDRGIYETALRALRANRCDGGRAAVRRMRSIHG